MPWPLDGATDFGLGVLAAAIAVAIELAGAITAFAAVQLDAAQGVRVETYTNGALGEAGLVQQADAQTKLFCVAVTLPYGLGDMVAVLCAVPDELPRRAVPGRVAGHS